MTKQRAREGEDTRRELALRDGTTPRVGAGAAFLASLSPEEAERIESRLAPVRQAIGKLADNLGPSSPSVASTIARIVDMGQVVPPLSDALAKAVARVGADEPRSLSGFGAELRARAADLAQSIDAGMRATLDRDDRARDVPGMAVRHAEFSLVPAQDDGRELLHARASSPAQPPSIQPAVAQPDVEIQLSGRAWLVLQVVASSPYRPTVDDLLANDRLRRAGIYDRSHLIQTTIAELKTAGFVDPGKGYGVTPAGRAFVAAHREPH